MIGTEFRKQMVIGNYMTTPARDDNFSAQNWKTGLRKVVGDFWKREVRSIKRKRRTSYT